MVTDSDTRHLNLSKSHIQMGRRGLRERLEAADKLYDCGDLLRIGLAPRVVETSEQSVRCCLFDRPARGRAEVDFGNPAATNDGFQVANAELATGHDL